MSGQPNSAAASATAAADPADALLSFAASPAAPSSVSAQSVCSADPSAPASSSAASPTALPTGCVRVWQVDVIRMWIGMRIEGINVGTNLFLTLEAALDFAYAQACRFEEMPQQSRDDTDAPDNAQQTLERAADGNYHWDDASYPGWGNRIKTQESTINFNSAPGAAIFSSSYSSDEC